MNGSLHQKSLDEQCNYHPTNFIDIKQHEDASLNEIVENFWKVKESGATSDLTKGPFSSKHTEQLEIMDNFVHSYDNLLEAQESKKLQSWHSKN